MVSLPRSSSWATMLLLSPCMIATTAITAATPMMMPSAVSALRRALARIAASAARLPSSTACANPEENAGSCMGVLPARLHAILGEPAVDQAHAAQAVVRDVLFVGDQDDGLALVVEFVEQAHDPGGGGAVEVAGGLVAKQD